MAESDLDRVRAIVLSWPGVTERHSHGAPCFFVNGTRALCYFHDDHRGDGRTSLWCPVTPEVQQELVAADPDRFFAPTTSASGAFRDWLSVFVDLPGTSEEDWQEISGILADAYRTIAPRTSQR